MSYVRSHALGDVTVGNITVTDGGGVIAGPTIDWDKSAAQTMVTPAPVTPAPVTPAPTVGGGGAFDFSVLAQQYPGLVTPPARSLGDYLPYVAIGGLLLLMLKPPAPSRRRS